MRVKHTNIPAGVVTLLLDQLREFGAVVTLDLQTTQNVKMLSCGLIRHVSGTASFSHYGDQSLDVVILHNPGHFPEKMLIGGIRQLVEEASEAFMLATRPTGLHVQAVGSLPAKVLG